MTKLPALPPLYQPSPNAQQQLALARKYLRPSAPSPEMQVAFQPILVLHCSLPSSLLCFISPSHSIFNLFTGEVLELAVLASVRQGDEAAFDRNFAQLRPYYLDARSAIPLSPQEALLSGIHLLVLLVQNRIAEFHTAVELLPDEVLATPEVAQVAQLEAWLMEGAYNKVLGARSSMASPYYLPLLDRLASTVRDEIASCSEAAYESLPAGEAAKMLRFSNETELSAYAGQRGWKLEGGRVWFPKGGQEGANGEEANGGAAPAAFDVIEHCMAYALQQERIV